MENQKIQEDKKVYYISITILAGIFFILGSISWLNSILIPYFRISCELTHFQSYFVTFSFYIAYLVMAIPSGFLLRKIGFKKGIMCGFIFASLGAFIFIPAALTRQYGIFLLGLFSIGTGLAILQTAANPYITIIGPIDSAARRISIMGICNKLAGILSPLIFAFVILKPNDKDLFALLEAGNITVQHKNLILDELIQRTIIPYTILGILLLLIGILIRYSILPEIKFNSHKTSSEEKYHEKKNIFSYPYLIFGVAAIFFHVGTQVIAIDTIINYATSMGMNLLEAKAFPSYTLGCTMIGYIIGIIIIPKYISQKKALIYCTILGLILSLGVVLCHYNISVSGHYINISIFFLCAIGLPNSLIYAGIWPLAIHDLGDLTEIGSSLLIMGLSGNAILPLIYGDIASTHNLQVGYWILIPSFLYLIFFALKGHKINSWF